MNSTGYIILSTVVIGIFLFLYWYFRLLMKLGKAHVAEQEQKEQLTLQLHPVYRQKLQEDRTYKLELQRLELARERQAADIDLRQQQFQLTRYLAMTRAEPETYIINEVPANVTALPSLKRAQPEAAQEITANAVPVPTFTDLLRTSTIASGQPLVIGARADSTLRVGSWLDLYTLAVAGLAGTGKSTSVLFYLLQAVLHGAKFVMIDPHAETKPDSLARRLAGLPAACFLGKIAITNQEILARVRFTAAELKRRQKTGKGSPIILVVDEFTRLMRTKEIAEELGELLEAIAQEGRGYNIFALLTGQVWVATRTGGTELRYSIASSLVHRIQEQQAELLIPHRYAKYCPELKTGQALLYDTNGQSEILSIPLTTTQDVLEVAAFLGTSQGTSAGSSGGTSQGTSYQLRESRDELPLTQGLKQREADTEPLEVPPLTHLDLQMLDCMSRGLSQNQIMGEVYGIANPGAAYQQKLPELRAAMQRIAQFTKAQQEKIGA